MTSSSFHPNGWPATQAAAGVSVTYTYDDFGLPDGWEATNGWRQELSRSNSAHLDEQRWSVHPTTGATFEVLGAYGLPLNGYTSGAPWVLDAFHGEEMDRDDQVQHLGARHLALRDGLWMQPEPLLHLGLTNGDLRNPIGFSGLYAAGNSNARQDRSGHFPWAAAWAVAEATATWADIAATAATGVAVVQGQATVSSFVTQAALTGVGMALPTGGWAAAAKAGDKVADAARAASHVPDATTVLNKAEAVADAAGGIRCGSGSRSSKEQPET